MNMSSGDISKGICRRFFQHPNTINQESPTFLAPGTVFMEKTIFPWTGGCGNGFGMIHAHYIYCALYYY